jgi:hypothetical protein
MHMKRSWRKILILSVALTGLAGGSPAWADSHHGRGHDHRHGHGYGPVYNLGFAYGPGYGYGPAYGYGFGWGIGYGYSGHGSSYGLSFSAPLYFGPRYYYPQPSVVLVPRAASAPQPVANAATTPRCLQTREYQTQVTIGDQTLPAYGTACLQADGSWRILSGPTVAD